MLLKKHGIKACYQGYYKFLSDQNQHFFIRYKHFPGKENKRKNKQIALHQTKNFYTAKEIINKIKRQHTEWENILADNLIRG